MKHILWILILIPFIFISCNGQSQKAKTEDTPAKESTISELTIVEKDSEEFVTDLPDFDNGEEMGEDEEDESNEEGEEIEGKPDFSEDIVPNDALIVKIDTLPSHKRYALRELVADSHPIGVVTRYIYPKEDIDRLYDRGDQLRQNFTGSSTLSLRSFDWDTSEEPFVIKNSLGTYLINPHKKPIYGFVIATMDSAPILYEGEDLDGVALIKSHFDIKTKEEFKKIVSENAGKKKTWIKNHHEQLYKEHFAKSNHNLKPKQIELLNRFIIDYQLKLRDLFAMPNRPYTDEFEGKVKRVNYKYRSASTSLDTTYVSLEYDNKSNLTKYLKYEMTRANDKTIYTFKYSKEGLLESVWDDNIRYKVYPYSDRIIVAKYPGSYDYSSKVLEESIMYITADGLPSEIEIRLNEEKGMHGNAKFVFDANRNLIHYDSGIKHVYNPRDYEYKGDKLTKVKMKQYVDNGMHDLIYEYHTDKVVMKSKNNTFTQKLEYDKKGNVLSAIFDGRAGIFETTSYIYEFEYF